jgi:hypothetical protein
MAKPNSLQNSENKMSSTDIDVSANIFSIDNSKIMEGAPNFIRNQLTMEKRNTEQTASRPKSFERKKSGSSFSRNA